MRALPQASASTSQAVLSEFARRAAAVRCGHDHYLSFQFKYQLRKWGHPEKRGFYTKGGYGEREREYKAACMHMCMHMSVLVDKEAGQGRACYQVLRTSKN